MTNINTIQQDKEFIIEQFHKVKNLGFVKSNRENNTGIGKTFEDYIGVVENNLDEPDLAGYEVKSHRELSESDLTIFTKSPSFIKGANQYLVNNFGYPYPENPSMKKLHISMFANRYMTCKQSYFFRLINDRDNRRILIEIRSFNTNEVLDTSCGYYYDDLERTFLRKASRLLFVKADTKIDANKKEFFHFTNGEIYTNTSFGRFLELIDQGRIMYDIRIGSYQSGKNKGKAHDHGSGFRIKPSDLVLLYQDCESI